MFHPCDERLINCNTPSIFLYGSQLLSNFSTDVPDAPVKQLVGLCPTVFHKGEPTRKPFSIRLDPFWFRQYNPETGMMEEPKDGTRFTLQVGFSSDDRDLFDYPFIYHNRK